VRDLIANSSPPDRSARTAPGTAFPQTEEEILRLFVTQYEQVPEKVEILRRELLACHGEMLEGLAVGANRTAKPNITNGEARRVIAGAVTDLMARKRLTNALQPVWIIDVLTRWHLLDRSSSNDGSIQFQHQQFQEWYASHPVARLMTEAAGGSDDARRNLRADILNVLSWEESILFACERLSREGEMGVQAVAAAIRDTWRSIQYWSLKCCTAQGRVPGRW
jgi:hypothetical protein